MSSNSAPPPPNYEPIAKAQKEMAKEQLQLQRDQYEWSKKTYAENKEITDKVVAGFLETSETNAKNAAADRARYEGIFQPLEDDLAREAKDWATPERKEREMGQAQANVAQQFSAARRNAQRNLESYGINPADTRYAALDLGVRTQQAAAAAGAGNQASDMVDATARALRSEAINVGRGYPGQIAGTYGTSLNAGQGANANMLATTASGANTMGTGTQWGALAGNNFTGAANTMNMGYKNQLDYFNANQQGSSGWGSALGLVAGAGLGFMGLPTTSVGGKMMGFAEGGAVGDGGVVPAQVSPSGGKAIDDVPAKLSEGEFIVPKDVVSWFGQKHMYGLIEKADKERQEKKQSTGAIPTVHPGAMAKSPQRQAIPMQ
jgi:hypothetical protein